MKINITVTRRTTLAKEVEMSAARYERLAAKLKLPGKVRQANEEEINALMDGTQDWTDDELEDVSEFEPADETEKP